LTSSIIIAFSNDLAYLRSCIQSARILEIQKHE
jgi:hypothetical protein